MDKQYKRTSRSVPQDVRTQIANTLKGRSRPESVKAKISASMKQHWADDNNFKDDVKM